MTSHSQPAADPYTAIRAAHEAWVEAVARGDTDALGNLLAEDYEAWPAGGAPIIGREASIAALRQALASVDIRQRFESTGLIVAGDWALDRGVETFVMTPRQGGPERRHRQRAVILLRRGPEGRWRYAWGMTSPEPPPMQPDVQRASEHE